MSLIAPHGGYKNLKSYQSAEIVLDLTVEFCRCYIDDHRTNATNRTNESYRSYMNHKSYNWSRQADQMIQAARSGSRNIGEGSQTSGTSKQSELRLVDVARASLAELLDDYKAFLRQNNLSQWGKDDRRALAIRELAYMTNRTPKTYMIYMTDAESAANCLICLINQTAYLLDSQIKRLSKDLLARGDLKDRLKTGRKKEWFGLNEDFDGFLAKQGLKCLEDGQVVEIDE